MGIKIREHLDVDNIDFTEIKLFQDYIKWDNLRYDIEQLEKKINKLKKELEKYSTKKYKDIEIEKESPINTSTQRRFDQYKGYSQVGYSPKKYIEDNDYDKNSDKAA